VKFTVEMEGSNVSIGGVLSLEQESQEWVTAYYSKTLNNKDRNYWHPSGVGGHHKVTGRLP
jgi:hypothetical protein